MCSSYNEWLLVDIVHVQGHQVLPAAQVETALVLIHQQDAVVTGVEGEGEGPRCSGVQQLWGGERPTSPHTRIDAHMHRHTHTETQT